MRIPLERLWLNNQARKLLVILPGASGITSGKSNRKGYFSIASYFWQRGHSVFLSNAPGQDSRLGSFDMQFWLDETVEVTRSICNSHGIRSLNFLGSCLGGCVASTAAKKLEANSLSIWETAIRYSQDHRRDFISHAKERRLELACDFWDGLIQLEDGLSKERRTCLYHGSKLEMPFQLEDLHEFQDDAPWASVKKIKSADHGLTAGSNPDLLINFCSQLELFINYESPSAN